MKSLRLKNDTEAFKKAYKKVPASLEVLEQSVDNFNFNMEYVDGTDLEDVEEAVEFSIGIAMSFFNQKGAYNKDFHRKAWKFTNKTQIKYRETSPQLVILNSNQLKSLTSVIESLYYCYRDKTQFESYDITMGELLEFK